MKITSLCLMSMILLIGNVSIQAQSSGGSFIDIIAGPDLIEECTDGIPTEYPYEVINNCGDFTVSTENDLIAFGCGGSFRQTITYTAMNDCGDVDVDVQIVDYIDSQAPFIQVIPEWTLTCDTPLPNIDDYEVFDCSGVTISTQEEFIPDCGAAYALIRTYTATDDCGFSSVATQTINVQDELAPEFNQEPSDLSLQCPEELTIPPTLTAIDNCDGEVDVYYYETNPFGGCEAYNSDVSGEDFWSFLLPGLPEGINEQFVWDQFGATLTQYENSVIISGIIHAIDDDSQEFYVHLVGTNGVDWLGWNSQEVIGGGPNRTYRDDLGLAENGVDLWETWQYFEIDANESFLAGQGSLSGSLLNISHAPTNFIYGLQLGMAANNKTPEFGCSSWLNFEGWVNGHEIELTPGSYSSEVVCFAVSSFCSYGFERNWVVHDGCGNVNTHTQYVIVSDETPPEIDCPTDALLACFTDYSPSSVGSAVAVDNCPQELLLDFIDIGDGNDCPGNVTRIWATQDICGNVNECVQEIVFQDDLGDPCPADINGDNVVDILDFIAFNSAFGSACSGCPEDITNDGVVDIEDFLELNSAFGPCPKFFGEDSDRGVSLIEEIDRLGMRNTTDPVILKYIDQHFGFELFPNPNSGSFQIMLGQDIEGQLELKIQDISGRVVETYVIAQGQRNLDHELTTGTYVATLVINGIEMASRRLLVK